MTARPGTTLPELVIEATPTFIIASALATRDFQDVHHDRDAALKRGSKDIFVNILTTTGLVQRYVTDWAGPQALVRSVAIRLGAPCYAGDTLTFSGEAVPDPSVPGPSVPGPSVPGPSVPGPAVPGLGAAVPGGAPAPGGTAYLVQVTGRCSLGDHVTGTVRVLVPVEPA